MKKYILNSFFVLLTGLFFSCSDSNSSNDGGDGGGSQPVGFSNEGAINGTLTINDEPVELNGSYRMGGGQFIITSTLGELRGPVTQTSGGYTITFDYFTGIYENGTEALTGEIVLTPTEVINLIFHSEHINGTADLSSYAYLSSLGLQKCVVSFVHGLVGRSARVELEDEYNQSLEPLGHLYQSLEGDGGSCLDDDHFGRYTPNSETHLVVMNDESWPYDEYNPYAPVAFFVVDKETFIDYKVYWDNGYVEQGRFFSDIGGSANVICLGNGAGGDQWVNSFYQNENETYSTSVCFNTLSTSGCTAGKRNMTIALAEGFYVHITDVPDEYGMYQFVPNGSACYDFSAGVSFPDDESFIVDGGYLILGENNSFEYKVEFDRNDGNVHTITGSGNYLYYLD